MHEVFIKEIDNQGRIILPKEWRKQIKAKKVIVLMEDNSIKIVPESKKLSAFFDKAKPSDLKPYPFENYEDSLAEASLR